MILLCVCCFLITLSVCALAAEVHQFMRRTDERLHDLTGSVYELCYNIESLASKQTDTERDMELLKGDTEK